MYLNSTFLMSNGILYINKVECLHGNILYAYLSLANRRTEMALESKRMIHEARGRKRKQGRWSRKLKDQLDFWKKNQDKALIDQGVSFGDLPYCMLAAQKCWSERSACAARAAGVGFFRGRWEESTSEILKSHRKS